MRTIRGRSQSAIEQVLFDLWFAAKEPVRDGEFEHVMHPSQPWICVAAGGGPYWVEVATTLDGPGQESFQARLLALARLLDAKAFDSGAQSELAACMTGWPVEQQAMRAAMDFGWRRRRALLDAAKAFHFFNGTYPRATTSDDDWGDDDD